MKMSMNPYEAVISDLKAKKQEIEQTIELIQKLYLKINESAALAPPQPENNSIISKDGFYGMSIVEAAKKLLDIKKTPLKAKVIANYLKEGGVRFTTDAPENTVFTLLDRDFKNSGDITKVGRGSWALSKWYAEDIYTNQFNRSNAVSSAFSTYNPFDKICTDVAKVSNYFAISSPMPSKPAVYNGIDLGCSNTIKNNYFGAPNIISAVACSTSAMPSVTLNGVTNRSNGSFFWQSEEEKDSLNKARASFGK